MFPSQRTNPTNIASQLSSAYNNIPTVSFTVEDSDDEAKTESHPTPLNIPHKKPNYSFKKQSLSQFKPILLDNHASPTHYFISCFFNDSWARQEGLTNYYDHSSLFTITVDSENDGIPSLHFLSQFSNNKLFPNNNFAKGVRNIQTFQMDYLFPNGFKAIPTKYSYRQLAPDLFAYVFHGVFECDYIEEEQFLRNKAPNYSAPRPSEILNFDRSITILLKANKFVISNDHLYVHLSTR